MGNPTPSRPGRLSPRTAEPCYELRRRHLENARQRIRMERVKRKILAEHRSLSKTRKKITDFAVSFTAKSEKKTCFEIPRILAKYRRLAMHVKEMQPSVSVLDATDRERTQRIVASFIINLFKSLSESAQDFDSQQPFTRSPPFAPPLIRCARQGQAAAAARRLCAHVALVRSLT